MREVTIESKYETLKTKEGRLPGSREMWAASGLKVYAVGPLPGLMFEQAANLAMNICCEMHIPAISMRYVGRRGQKKAFETKSGRLI